MCLAIPGKIRSVEIEDPVLRAGKVDFGGVSRQVNLAYVPDAQVGDYVIVHVGFAISKLDEAEANQVFEYLKQMDEAALNEELGIAPSPPAPLPEGEGSALHRTDTSATSANVSPLSPGRGAGGEGSLP